MQVAFPDPGPGARVHVGEGLNVPGLLLEKVTVPVALIGLVEMSLTVTVQLVGTLTITEPGAHVTEVVVEWVADGIVALTVNDPELLPWLDELVLPSPHFQTSW